MPPKAKSPRTDKTETAGSSQPEKQDQFDRAKEAEIALKEKEASEELEKAFAAVKHADYAERLWRALPLTGSIRKASAGMEMIRTHRVAKDYTSHAGRKSAELAMAMGMDMKYEDEEGKAAKEAAKAIQCADILWAKRNTIEKGAAREAWTEMCHKKSIEAEDKCRVVGELAVKKYGPIDKPDDPKKNAAEAAEARRRAAEEANKELTGKEENNNIENGDEGTESDDDDEEDNGKSTYTRVTLRTVTEDLKTEAKDWNDLSEPDDITSILMAKAQRTSQAVRESRAKAVQVKDDVEEAQKQKETASTKAQKAKAQKDIRAARMEETTVATELNWAIEARKLARQQRRKYYRTLGDEDPIKTARMERRKRKDAEKGEKDRPSDEPTIETPGETMIPITEDSNDDAEVDTQPYRPEEARLLPRGLKESAKASGVVDLPKTRLALIEVLTDADIRDREKRAREESSRELAARKEKYATERAVVTAKFSPNLNQLKQEAIAADRIWQSALAFARMAIDRLKAARRQKRKLIRTCRRPMPITEHPEDTANGGSGVEEHGELPVVQNGREIPARKRSRDSLSEGSRPPGKKAKT
ncbi:MAG: hypothetical protein M1814_006853 [Vezdaea aestivalis]|nr:MAG: hypothetical protein M1814_006853 [Vezdaea aestivalis]